MTNYLMSWKGAPYFFQMVIKHFDLPSRCHVFSNGSETDMKTQDLTNLQELLLIKIIDNVLIYTVIIFFCGTLQAIQV